MNSFKFLSFILILLPLPGWAQVPASFVYQGQITKSGGVPLEANPVIFNVRVYSPVNDCLMYEEQHSINMLGSEGIFSLNVGAGIRSGSDFEDTSSIIDIFKNGINHTGITTCSSGSSYTAIAGHTRKVRISYNDGSGQVTLAQDFHLQTVPYAWYANSLQGLTATNFVQINVGQNITQSNLENLLGGSNYNTLFNLASGTSTSPLSLNNQQIKNLADPTLAQDAATKNYTDTKIAGSNIDVSGVGAGVGDGRVLSWNATLNRWEATTPSALSDATKLPLAGGTMAGNINMNGNQVLNTGHLTMQNLSTITLGKFSNAQEVTLVGTLAAGNKGATWYNSDTDQIMYWDGNSAEAVGSGSGTGDIEAIVTNAGSALSGGVNSGSATLSVVTDGVTMETNGTNQLQVKDAGISAAKLATDAVDSTKIVDGSLVNADINAGAGIAWSKINKTGAIASEVGAVAPARAINTNTGSGLTGGGDLSADRSLAINTDNSSVEISTNTLQVKDAGITNAKIVSVGVAKVTSAAAEYFSYMPAGTECSPNNTLIWDAVNDRWVCGVLPSSFSFVADVDNDTKIQLEETADEDKIRFDTAGSERMIIDEVGRVGIGTTTPAARLDVEGTLQIGDGGETCATGANAGMLKYTAGILQYCNGSAWQTLGVSGAVTGSALNSARLWVGDAGNTAQPVLLSGDASLSNTGALTIVANAITSSKILDGTLATDDFGDGQVTDAKVSTLSVSKITSAATQYFSYMPAGTECNSNEVLKWDAVTDRWICGVDNNTGAVTSVFSRTGAVVSQNGDYTAAQITNVAAGNIAATTAQAAINELDGEKVAKAGDTMTGPLNLPANGLVVGTNQLVSVSNNIGIGTATASEKLVVNGNILTLGGGISSGTAGGGFRATLSNPGAGHGRLTLTNNSAADTVLLDAGASSYLNGGNVGIGTTSPDTKLHISGTSGATLKIVDGNQATGRVLTSDANGVASWAVAGAASAAGANTQIQYNNSGSLGASSKFVWNNTLNILGLSASAGGYPTVALSYDDGSGDVQQSSLTAGGLTTTMGGNNYGSVSLGHDNLTLLAKTGAGDWPRLLMKTASSSGGYLTSGSAMGSLKFGGYNDLDGAGVRAVASETHNVSSRGTHLFISSTPNGSTTPVSRIAILQNGNVGIGTTAPERLLHVNGVLRMTASTTPGAPAAGDIFVDSADSNKLKYYNGSAWVEAGGGGGANLGAVAQNVLPAIDSTYDLGSASHYWQNGYVRNLTAGDITAYFTVNADKFTTMGGGSQTAAAYSNSGDPNNGIFFPAADVTAFTTNNVERLRINSTGNVGIGTTVPNEKLQVAGNIRAIADNSSGYVVSYADVYSNNTGESGFFISRRGRGTMSSPSYPQTGDQLGGISFRSYNSTVGPRMSGFATENQNAGAQGGAMILTTVANGGTTEFERVRITQDGNVGIGTNNPVAKLEVSGNLKIGSDNTTCDSTRLGTMRFENDFLFVCKSTGWAVVQTTSPVAALSVAPSSATLDLTGGVSPGGYTSFTFTNSGSATTSTIATNLSNTTNFQIGSNTCASATLSPGSNCIIQVRAIASSNTTYSGTVSATAGAASASASLSGTSTGFSASPPDCSLFTSPEPNTAGYMYFPVSTTQKVMTMCTFSGMTSTWVTNSGSCWGTGCWTSPASSPRTGTGGVEFDVSNSLVPGFDKIYRCNAGIVQMSTSGGAFVNQNWSGGAQNGQPLRCVSY